MIPTREMRTALAVAALAAALVVAPPTSAAFAAQQPSDGTDISSGSSLSGALSAHGADLEGSVDRRALEGELARADDEETRAALLADRRIAIERRIEALEARRGELRAQRRDGTLSASAYRVRAASLTAELRGLRGLLDTVERESRRLPSSLRETYGLDDGALNRSRARIEATTDPEFAATYAAIVGEDPPREATDRSMAAVRNETELVVRRTASTRAELGLLVDRLDSEDADEAVLECTRRNLTSADDALDLAADGLERDDGATAEAALVDARTDLRRARSCLEGLDGNWTAGDRDGEWNGSDTDSGWDESDFENDTRDYDYEEKDSEFEDRDGDRDDSDWSKDGSTSEFESRDADG